MSIQFTPEQLEALGFSSSEEATNFFESTKKEKQEQQENEYTQAVSAFSKEQLEGLSALFGESKADQLKGIQAMKQFGFVSEPKPKEPKEPKAKEPAQGLAKGLTPRQTAKPSDAPQQAPKNEFSHLAKYNELKGVNEIAARNYYVANMHSILREREASQTN